MSIPPSVDELISVPVTAVSIIVRKFINRSAAISVLASGRWYQIGDTLVSGRVYHVQICRRHNYRRGLEQKPSCFFVRIVDRLMLYCIRLVIWNWQIRLIFCFAAMSSAWLTLSTVSSVQECHAKWIFGVSSWRAVWPHSLQMLHHHNPIASAKGECSASDLRFSCTPLLIKAPSSA